MSDAVAVQEIYRQKIERWRKAREEALRAPDGWLSLAGLFVLESGDYTVGSGIGNRIVLPEGAPTEVGILRYREGEATLQPVGDVALTVNGAPVGAGVTVKMVDNANGRPPTMLKFGNITLNLHRFGDEVALRVRDSTSPVLAEFEGCKWYVIKDEYCVQGRLARQPEPASIPVTTSVKSLAHYQNIGTISFELFGKPLQLMAAPASKSSELFVIFRDATAGHTTYGAGRYLYVEVDEADNVIVDFNKAYNPPCAFTPYATCSLPPAQNLLRVAIEAGELY